MYCLTRIEISYVANSQLTRDIIFSESFVEDSKKDLKNFEKCLNLTPGICYRVPLIDLLHTFQQETKFNQLYIRLHYTAAIIYCQNVKKGSFCGYVYDIPKL